MLGECFFVVPAHAKCIKQVYAANYIYCTPPSKLRCSRKKHKPSRRDLAERSPCRIASQVRKFLRHSTLVLLALQGIPAASELTIKSMTKPNTIVSKPVVQRALPIKQTTSTATRTLENYLLWRDPSSYKLCTVIHLQPCRQEPNKPMVNSCTCNPCKHIQLDMLRLSKLVTSKIQDSSQESSTLKFNVSGSSCVLKHCVCLGL